MITFQVYDDRTNEVLYQSKSEIKGELIRAVEIKKPDYIELSSTTYDDYIEFVGVNTITEKGKIKLFYFNEDESPAISNIKKMIIVEQLIKDLQEGE